MSISPQTQDTLHGGHTISRRIWGPAATVLLVVLVYASTAAAVDVERYKTLELVLTAASSPANSFDTVLLKIEVVDPGGRVFTVEGFYDGDGNGGQSGRVWKARLCPYATGTWGWRTVTGDAPDPALAGLSGSFNCVSGSDLGGIVAQGKHFKFENGGYVYLVGNFLDFALGHRTTQTNMSETTTRSARLMRDNQGIRTTHTYMSETTTDAQRDAIITRQRDFHTSNKANIYFANRGDYSSQSVTPWVGTASSPDRTRMDLARWKLYDCYLRRFKDSKMLAEMWFFADDSNFGGLPEADQKRLIRYALARTSAFSHTMYVLALEWEEGFTKTRINSLGTYFQQLNPWGRVVSVHNQADWQFGDQTWPDFIATQTGNGAGPDQVNSTARRMNSTYGIPHIDVEFGVLSSDTDSGLRANLWACLSGGAAGGGTGSDLKALQRFLNQSRIPFQSMSPANGLVTGGGTNRFCLAESGRHYLVYSQTGSFTLNVTGSGLSGRWFDPRDPGANLGGSFPVATGSQTFTPPSSATSDWVLWITDGSNLNSGATNPSIGATIVQVVVDPLVQHGWMVWHEQAVWGWVQHNGWWRAGQRANITRRSVSDPDGDVRPNRTEDLNLLTDNMLKYGYPGFEHNFGLWYDRRRDAHDETARATPDCQPPFLEQPWARSGQGQAADGQSKYDLTKFNDWYFERVKRFADLCDAKGTVLFYKLYMQHALLEGQQHYVDFPWRPANCLQDTGMPDRMPAANAFYDVSNPERARLHRLYLRKCLEVLGGNRNVVFLPAEEYTGPLAFAKFYVDTILEWEAETGKHVTIGLGAPKDVQDAILADPRAAQPSTCWTCATGGCAETAR